MWLVIVTSGMLIISLLQNLILETFKFKKVAIPKMLNNFLISEIVDM